MKYSFELNVANFLHSFWKYKRTDVGAKAKFFSHITMPSIDRGSCYVCFLTWHHCFAEMHKIDVEDARG